MKLIQKIKLAVCWQRHNYPFTCKPEDVWASRQADHENYFFIDVQSRGEYPAYALKKMERDGIVIDMT